MREERLLPASTVLVTVHPPPGAGRSGSRIPEGKRHVVVLGITPLVIVVLLSVLFLGGIGDYLVFITIALMAALVVGLVQRDKYRSRMLYSSSRKDWMSRVALYVGPFDHTGLPDAANFERRHSVSSNPPQVRLLVTDDGFVFGPSGHAGTPMIVRFNDLESVDLIEGIRPRMLVVTPPVAYRVGQVELRTIEGRIARFSGLPIQGVEEALRDRGASIEVEG
jgi:hypothetical protein